VWSWGNSYRRDDLLDATDVTPRIASHVRGTFASFLAQSGRARFAEKTPSNCLRLPFVSEIFPDAVFVHVVRDGRAVVEATMRKLAGAGPASARIAARLRESRLRDLPSLAPRALLTVGRRLLRRDMAYWGPRPPGWRAWMREDSVPVMGARQWRHTVEPALDFGAAAPGGTWFELRFEDLVAEPSALFSAVLEHCGLDPAPAALEWLAGRCDLGRAEAWRRRLVGDDLAAVESIARPLLDRLGYD
jgi:hypothetical protein